MAKQILNDAKAKYKTDKTLLQTLIDNSPLSDHVFEQIIEAYETNEEVAMVIMIECKEGEFERDNIECGWKFISN